MTSIGIVGTGISGLNLALTLQQAGLDTTVYAERTPDELRRTRLPNAVVRHAPAIARERALGADHWRDGRIDVIDFSILDTPIACRGHLAAPASGVDFRVYLPQLLEDYAARGGDVVVGARSPEQIAAGAGEHDLTVVASGRDSIKAFFPRDDARSTFDSPQRILCATLCHGVAAPDVASVNFEIIPGVGEIFVFPFRSREDGLSIVGFEAVPGGPLEPLAHASYEADPAAFDALVIETLRRFAPTVHERVDRSAFGVAGPLDILQGAITPVVRRPYCEVAPGKFVVAVGDAHVTNDPVCGQGANLGSATAAVLADAICQDVAYDEWFCRGVARRMWAVAEPVTNFNNTFLLPPPPHVEEILGAAAARQDVADAFANNFADPAAMWRAIATPERAAAFLAGFGLPAAALAA